MTAVDGTTMTVQVMGRMLGLKKTESYYLLHKHHFETVTINHQLRVVRSSFEEWYDHQDRYRKIDGPVPGVVLQTQFYSIADLSEMLAVSDETIRDLIHAQGFPFVTIGGKFRIPKAVFDRWYVSQSRYRNAEARERDRLAEEASMTIAEMGRLIGLDRRQAWSLYSRNRDLLETIVIAEKPRITKDSFQRWYLRQNRYRLVSESSDDDETLESVSTTGEESAFDAADPSAEERLTVPEIKEFISVREAADCMGMSTKQIYRLIENGELESKKIGKNAMIRITDLQNSGREEEENGNDCSP